MDTALLERLRAAAAVVFPGTRAHYHDYKETFRTMHETRLRQLARRGL